MIFDRSSTSDAAGAFQDRSVSFMFCEYPRAAMPDSRSVFGPTEYRIMLERTSCNVKTSNSATMILVRDRETHRLISASSRKYLNELQRLFMARNATQ